MLVVIDVDAAVAVLDPPVISIVPHDNCEGIKVCLLCMEGVAVLVSCTNKLRVSSRLCEIQVAGV